HDNADERLTPLGREIGLVSDERYRRFEERQERVVRLKERLDSTRVGTTEEVQAWMATIGTTALRRGAGPTLTELLRRPEVRIEDLSLLDPVLAAADRDTLHRVEMEVKYEGYIVRQKEQVERHRRLEEKLIPERVDYQQIRGLSREAREKLALIRPRSIGQAARISGVSPADISVLLVHLHARERTAAH